MRHRDRVVVPAVAASLLTALGTGGTFMIVRRGDQGGPNPSAAATVDGAEPTCGVDLPVKVTVGDDLAAEPGPSPTGDPVAPGQVVEHWNADFGTVEVRWPADPRPLYDLTGERSTAMPGLEGVEFNAGRGYSLVATVFPDDGNPGFSSSDPSGVEVYRLTGVDLTAPGEPPCDVLQVRVLGHGWQMTEGWRWRDFRESVVNLRPLVIWSGSAARAPDVSELECPIGPDLPGPVAATPAAALDALVSSEANRALQEGFAPRDGYSEYVGDDEYLYTIPKRGAPLNPVATAVVVSAVDGGWQVTDARRRC